VYFGIFNDCYYVLLEFYYSCVNGSVGLNSIFHQSTFYHSNWCTQL